MGNFSRDTFDALKHYVGVRLQQGVPLVDADWNEQEDIRRFELQAFLKWFVGDGVPAGNDGFKIATAAAVVGNVSLLASAGLSGGGGLNAGRVYVFVDLERSTAAPALGFGPANATASGLRTAAIAGAKGEPFALQDGMKLFVGGGGIAGRVDDPRPQRPQDRPLPGLPGAGGDQETGRLTITQKMRSEAVEVTFSAGSFKDIGRATAREVVTVISAALVGRPALVAGLGWPDNFLITGGDGTATGAGRCLVEGWDVLNPKSLTYTEQPLFEAADPVARWGVDPLDALTTPVSDRTDLVFLDVWEREVRATDDEAHLVNPAIGIETCTRIKREWAVRVLEGCDLHVVPPRWLVRGKEQPVRRPGHIYYPLALLRRKAGQESIQAIEDLRRTGLGVLSRGLEEAFADTLGAEYVSAVRAGSSPNRPPVSLRDALNALLAGDLPGRPAAKVPLESSPFFTFYSGLSINQGDQVWLFSANSMGGNQGLCFDIATDTWSAVAVPTNLKGLIFGVIPINRQTTLVLTNDGTVLRMTTYFGATGQWSEPQQIAECGGGEPMAPKVLQVGDDQLWVFWRWRDRIRYRAYTISSGLWSEEFTVGPQTFANKVQIAVVADGAQRVWLFIFEDASGVQCRSIDVQSKQATAYRFPGNIVPLNADPIAAKDASGKIWVVWRTQKSIYAAGQAETWTSVTVADGTAASDGLAVVPTAGGTWVFWLEGDTLRAGVLGEKWQALTAPLAEDVGDSHLLTVGAGQSNAGLFYTAREGVRCITYVPQYNQWRLVSASLRLSTKPAKEGWITAGPFAIADRQGTYWLLWGQMLMEKGSPVVPKILESELWYRQVILEV